MEGLFGVQPRRPGGMEQAAVLYHCSFPYRYSRFPGGRTRRPGWAD